MLLEIRGPYIFSNSGHTPFYHFTNRYPLSHRIWLICRRRFGECSTTAGCNRGVRLDVLQPLHHRKPRCFVVGEIKVLYDITRLVMPEHVHQNLESYMQASLGAEPPVWKQENSGQNIHPQQICEVKCCSELDFLWKLLSGYYIYIYAYNSNYIYIYIHTSCLHHFRRHPDVW